MEHSSVKDECDKRLENYVYNLKMGLLCSTGSFIPFVGLFLLGERVSSIGSEQFGYHVLNFLGLTDNYMSRIAGAGAIASAFLIVFDLIQFLGYKKPITTNKYEKLKKLASKLSENGQPKLQEKVKKLIDTQGQIKNYQYNILMYDFEDIEKSLVIQKKCTKEKTMDELIFDIQSSPKTSKELEELRKHYKKRKNIYLSLLLLFVLTLYLGVRFFIDPTSSPALFFVSIFIVVLVIPFVLQSKITSFLKNKLFLLEPIDSKSADYKILQNLCRTNPIAEKYVNNLHTQKREIVIGEFNTIMKQMNPFCR